MAYQRKKRSHEEQQQRPVNTEQNSLFASPDLETPEAETTLPETETNEAPSMEMLQRQVEQGGYNFGDIPLFAPDRPVQREPLSPLMQMKLGKPRPRYA
ncbi:MAG: hypothetical protein F6K42_16400, partial [Leptolyngbya sp. SIO1D8]|nr:hypothetical protein [Leptolyngbya sp. SIO1D8]